MEQEIKQVKVWNEKDFVYDIVKMKLYCVICGDVIPRSKDIKSKKRTTWSNLL